MSVRPSIVIGNSCMQCEPAAFLWDVHEATLRIREFVAGHDFNSYEGSYWIAGIVVFFLAATNSVLTRLRRQTGPVSP